MRKSGDFIIEQQVQHWKKRAWQQNIFTIGSCLLHVCLIVGVCIYFSMITIIPPQTEMTFSSFAEIEVTHYICAC